ncbi:MAG: UDP-N-acetylenolpyruvoylglucosamine reductase [Flaviaesturariibacter sp.]|nr:UDP-N-acetylenolpyruvoylglucosamine reductase [Flaviaesturariibacter sp.]
MELMQIQENVSLQPYNTFGIDVKAHRFSSCSSVEQLRELVSRNGGPLLIVGGGSNILCTHDFEGLVLKNEISGIEAVKEDEDFVFVKAGAGVNWHHFVLFCLENNYAGAENLSLIPGSVGASPMQNIGAYGVEIKDIFEELEALHIPTGDLHRFSLEECRFGYRESIFKTSHKSQYVITSVTYRLRKTPVFNTSYGAIQQELERMGISELSIKAISQAVINIRTSKLPDWKEIGNAGSFFKNPHISLDKFEKLKQENPTIVSYPQGAGMKLAAGWLIEQCGWKGFRDGDAGCYTKQALVLVNYGKATGQEIYDLSERIILSVKEKFGVDLEREVNII